MANAAFTKWKEAQITGYTYLLDLENGAGANDSCASYGASVTGKVPVHEKVTLDYRGEFAWQTDYADSKLGYGAPYYVTEAGATYANGGLLSGPMSFERNLSYMNRRIESGDLLYIPFCGTSYLGYTACLYCTFIVRRKPTAKEKDWFKQMKERLDVCIERTKIGASTEPLPLTPRTLDPSNPSFPLIHRAFSSP